MYKYERVIAKLIRDLDHRKLMILSGYHSDSTVHFKTTTKPKIKYCPFGHFSELWFMSRKPKPFLWVSEINISIDVDDTLVHKSLACPNSLAWAKETVSYTFYKEIAQLAARSIGKRACQISQQRCITKLTADQNGLLKYSFVILKCMTAGIVNCCLY